MQEAGKTDDQLPLLIENFIANTCSREEMNQLLLLANDAANEKEIGEVLKSFWDKSKDESAEDHVDWDERMKEMLEEIKPETPVVKLDERKSRINWKRMMVAASLLFLVATSYWYFNQKKAPQEIAGDVKAPETNRAMITLSNGKKVYLDDVSNGTVMEQSGVQLRKQANGQIVYSKGDQPRNRELQYNTLSNPRGSRVIDVTLSDGSRVWLNAGSSITYPVDFVGKERDVAITGEAYFEVASNATVPFKVNKNDLDITVLGTHFNVNAYNDEAQTKITLLEGSVRTDLRNGATAILKPGEQANVTNQIKLLKDVDVQQVMAWKEGMFRFKDSNIEDIMRQAARWYDVDIEYKTDVSDLNFGGIVSRQANISQLLKKLEATEELKFKVEGRKVIVMKAGRN